MNKEPIESFNAKTLSINVILNPLFGKKEIQNLKF